MSPSPASRRILVWDLPTRIFHWALAGSFVVAFVTADSERWRDVHVLAGYTMLALVAFRVLWGIVGSRYARFASFPPAPRRAIAYLRDLIAGRAPSVTGHNPAGAIAIYALLATALLAGITGLAVFNDIGGHALEEVHEVAANAMLALVGLHLLGVLVGSLAHGENLAKSMLTGYKTGAAGDAIRGRRVTAAAVLVAAIVALWTGVLPAPGLEAEAMAARHEAVPADAEHESDRNRSHERSIRPPDAHPRS
jgi:cytochrome b